MSITIIRKTKSDGTQVSNKDGKHYYRIILKFKDQLGNNARRERSYYVVKNSSPEKEYAEANIYGEKLMREVEDEIKLEKKKMSPSFINENMLFGELADRWLNSTYDLNNRKAKENVTYNYYLDSVKWVSEYKKEMGHLKVKEITTETIQKYYRKLDAKKIIKSIIKVRPSIKEVLKSHKITYNLLRFDYGISCSCLNRIMKFENISELNALKICDVTGIDFDKLFEKETIIKNYSESTVYGWKKRMRCIFGYANLNLKIINDNPASSPILNYNKESDTERESLTKDQAVALFEASSKFDIKIKNVIRLALLTGCRPEEIGGLEWRDIDFDASTLTIARAIIYSIGEGNIEKTTKTKKIRKISISEILVSELREYQKWVKTQGEELKKSLDNNTDKVFFTNNFNTLNSQVIRNWFNKVRDYAKLPPNLTPYNLRHTNLTLMLNENVPLPTISSRAGHASVDTTIRNYIHATSDVDRKAAETINLSYLDSYKSESTSEVQRDIEEFRLTREKMKLLGLKTMQEYYDCMDYVERKKTERTK